MVVAGEAGVLLRVCMCVCVLRPVNQSNSKTHDKQTSLEERNTLQQYKKRKKKKNTVNHLENGGNSENGEESKYKFLKFRSGVYQTGKVKQLKSIKRIDFLLRVNVT